MKVHRDLIITADARGLERLAAAIEKRLTDGWKRNRDAEHLMPRVSGRVYCFECSARDRRAAAQLWIAPRDEQNAWVPNIVPVGRNALSMDEYNSILEEFYRDFASRAEGDAEVGVEITPPEVGLEHFGIKPSTLEALHSFSSLANKSTGASHPSDQVRWFKFLILAHWDHARLNASTLARWLNEEEGWPEDTASELAQEYEFARDLLDAYDDSK